MIAMKFGGTSTQDAIAMTNVARIVKERVSAKPVIVISAIAQATNFLESAGKLAAEGKPGEARDSLLKLIDRHYAIVDELIKDKARHIDLRKFLATSLSELEELVRGVAILRELTPRTQDAFYCYGELLSSRIVAAVLEENGVKSQWLDTKDFMVTDENHLRALPLMDVVEPTIQSVVLPLIEQGIVPVTQGFIGVTQSGRRTTMGRESSDYSAAIIGAALNVKEVQIWTDVDGILTADPRIVASPKKVKTLSFEEAYELSYFGAKVLHPNTMLPAIEKNIPIYIFNSKRPQLSGSCVASASGTDQSIVKSVAYKRNLTILTVKPKKRYSQFIFWEHIYSILTKYGAVVSLTATSEYSMCIALDKPKQLASIVHELEETGFVQVHEDKGIVCVVGENIRQAPHLVASVFQSVAEFGPLMISFGASPSNLSFTIDDKYLEDAVRRIHHQFFEMSENGDIFEELEPVSASVPA